MQKGSQSLCRQTVLIIDKSVQIVLEQIHGSTLMVDTKSTLVLHNKTCMIMIMKLTEHNHYNPHYHHHYFY